MNFINKLKLKEYLQQPSLVALCGMALLGCTTSKSQIHLKNWNIDKPVELIVGSRTPIPVGEISKKGEVTFHLDENTFNKIRSEKQNQIKRFTESHKDIKMENTILKNEFPLCKDSIPFENGDAIVYPMAQMGTFGVWDPITKKPFGYLRIVNTKEFNETFFNRDPADLSTGYYLNFIYIEQTASVSGNCSSVTFETVDGETKTSEIYYNMHLKPGWNIIKTEIQETVKDKSGNIFPLIQSFTTLDSIPEEAVIEFTGI